MQILSKSPKHRLPLEICASRTYLVQNAISDWKPRNTLKHTETEPCLSVCSVCSVVKQSSDSDPDPDLMKP